MTTLQITELSQNDGATNYRTTTKRWRHKLQNYHKIMMSQITELLQNCETTNYKLSQNDDATTYTNKRTRTQQKQSTKIGLMA